MTSGEKKQLALLIFVWALLAVVFSFYDLKISIRLYDPDSAWAYMLEAYGQIPGLIVALLGGSVLLRLRGWKPGWKEILLTLFYAGFTLLAALVIWADLQGVQVGDEISVGWTISLGALTVTALQVLLRFIPHERLLRFEKPARVAVLLYVFAPLLTTWFFKFLWGRVTFRELASGYIDFTPWYLPQGYTGHRSFISGHTGFAWLVLPLTLLATKGRRAYYLVWLGVLLWGISVAVSRVVIGAHFASDVLFATGISFLWFFALRHLIMKGKG